MTGGRLERVLAALGEETLRQAPAAPAAAWLRLAARRRAERRRELRLGAVKAAAALLPSAALAAAHLSRPPGPLLPLLLVAVPAALGLGLLAAARARRGAGWPDDLSRLARRR